MNLLNNENNDFTFLITCHFFAKLYYFTKVRKKPLKSYQKYSKNAERELFLVETLGKFSANRNNLLFNKLIIKILPNE